MELNVLPRSSVVGTESLQRTTILFLGGLLVCVVYDGGLLACVVYDGIGWLQMARDLDTLGPPPDNPPA